MLVRFDIDGKPYETEARPGESLLPVLRRLGFWSVKHGCETGDCGACLVLLDGEPRLACLTPAARASGHAIATAEGLGDPEELHPLQRAFLDRGAVQCGYCTPAMLLAAAALLKRDPEPSEEAVREALAGVLCRCTGYVKPVEAILVAAGRDKGTRAGAEGEPPGGRGGT
jgi:putative selenate reductase molybdopterin-binding subunit